MRGLPSLIRRRTPLSSSKLPGISSTIQDSSRWFPYRSIVMTKDGRYYGPAFQAFSSAITSTLRNNTFLELKGGKRIFLQEYQPPAVGGIGAIFSFPRLVDGKPILEAKSGEIRFYSLFPNKMSDGKLLELNMRFKIDKMMYGGVLEY